MEQPHLLIANRAEIAVRIAASATELGWGVTTVAPADDASCGHCRLGRPHVEIGGSGPAAYLDVDALIAAASESGATHVHPGYGFLAESAAFAEAVTEAAMTWIGPSVDALRRFGDKAATRELCGDLGVPVVPGTGPLPAEQGARAEVRELFDQSGAVMIKAVAGGGGRGMRVVRDPGDLDDACRRASSEATAAFGDGRIYAESLIGGARHVEVQFLGDGGSALVVGTRDCSVQRQHQKVIERAPAVLDADLEAAMVRATLDLATAVGYRSAGTAEFLVAGDDFYCIEVNPRIQVEHCVTEAVTGLDLVAAQLQLSDGRGLEAVDSLRQMPRSGSVAFQARVCAEVPLEDGTVRPAVGRIDRFSPPSGPGVRVDTAAYAGYQPSVRYDSLLAKVIVVRPTAAAAAAASASALAAMDLSGIETNASVLAEAFAHPDVVAGLATTEFWADNISDLVRSANVDDPLAVLDVRPGDGPKRSASSSGTSSAVVEVASAGPEPDANTVAAPMVGTVVSVEVAVGNIVAKGHTVAVLEAMKMEHVVAAPIDCEVTEIFAGPGTTLGHGEPMLRIVPVDDIAQQSETGPSVDVEHIRADLADVEAAHARGFDDNRPEAVARRHQSGRRTARENLADLLDDGSAFLEYGPLTLAAQRRRRTVDELRVKTPGDGLVGGIGQVNGDLFGPEASKVMAISYDYMVLAGTQGANNHRKKDRLFDLAARYRRPVVLFAEGGGGRPGDTDGLVVAGLDGPAFTLWAELSGQVPRIGINGGYYFAGNAALLGCCDLIIATKDSYVGMGGPAMIEGGGLGVYHPTEVGPVAVQEPNGVLDIVVDDEAEATAVARKAVSYFQGTTADFEAADQRKLRHLIPENRLRVYDVRAVIDTLFDVDSVLEIRPHYGTGMICALARIEGRPVGVIANNPVHLAGAIDAEGAEKAARHLQLCDAFDIPVVSLCDTPGFMVGPDAEATGLVRRVSRMFVAATSITVPLCTVVLRKGYGLGAQAMAGGDFKAGLFTVSWPTGEFGGMGLEGAVKLGYRNELAAIEDPAERAAAYEARVAQMYAVGKATSMAEHFEIDGVIDPAETRSWIVTALATYPEPRPTSQPKRPMVDTW